MAGDTGGRPLLPQTAQSFTFTPPTLAPRENQRNYVFVDEHNRHKRLKVMRACEGCRRRKIKCDAATTNSWPCAACIRLKLNCVPPTVNYENKEFGSGTQTFELDRSAEYNTSIVSGSEDYTRQHAMLSHIGTDVSAVQQQMQVPYTDSMRMYQTPPYLDQSQMQPNLQYSTMSAQPVMGQELKYPQPVYPVAPTQIASPESEAAWASDSAAQLTEQMGDLKIFHTGEAPYIANQKKTLSDAPPVEEVEVPLPQTSSHDHTVRIPPEMMPSEAQALQYFDYFFTNIHPYCPVINPPWFYHQWQHDRESISTLVLEAIFACASLMMEESPSSNKWLALASKHEESFKDVPRLSTIQAMILIMKAREASPKRGYFYRSWMTVVNLVAMAKDLDLHEHLDTHRAGRSCGSSPSDCLTKTRVWHTLFILEVMVGGPQGRFEFGVDLDTIDLSVPRTPPSPDDPEGQISRQFTYFLRAVKNVQMTTVMHGKLKKKNPDWASDLDFVEHNNDFALWLQELPHDLQVAYPPDGSYPWIPSHFIGNMHCYQYLAVIMHHRPQLARYNGSYLDPGWKLHMLTCYSAAKNMCRLQEAILHNWGIQGLLCMQRGISFTIYAVLTCAMLHLVAITAPDPDFNTDAKEYFTRHMRILEKVAPHWPMPEMQEQVNALRTAFSADVSKPFELKPSFPFNSPSPSHSSPPINTGQYRPPGPGQKSPMEQQPGQVTYYHPISPPISATDTVPKTDSPVVQSMVMMAAGQPQPQTSASMQLQEPVSWNPAPIFDQWNTAFGTPPPSSSSQSSPPLRQLPSSGTSYEMRTPQQENSTAGFHAVPTNVSPTQHHSGGQGPQSSLQQIPAVSYATPTPSFVTPSMWQDVVASSFGDGLKRRWDYSNPGMMESGQALKRSR